MKIKYTLDGAVQNITIFIHFCSLAWFGFYRDGQFYWWRKPEDPEKTTDLSQVTDLLHNVVHLALIDIRTHDISGNKH